MRELDHEYSGVRNDHFSTKGFDRGRSRHIEIAWYFVKVIFFLSPWPWPNRLKRRLLILFGAKVGKSPNIRPRVSIHFPWKFSMGDYCWIGDSCEILNLEPITMEDHVALAHEVYLAAGGHDIYSRSLAYDNRPIIIKRGTWIATRAMIGPGVEIGENCVVAGGAIVMRSMPENSIIAGNPAKVIGVRELLND
jgi:putative colanic acid biosynthesis acetyltransferase WcaF